jgi:hypothetical protein
LVKESDSKNASDPTYVEILTRLLDSVEPAIKASQKKRRLEGKDETEDRESYRRTVIHEIVTSTESYLTSLPDRTKEGAVVTLKDYGYRNRDDVIRRIELGMYARVEKSFEENF